MSPLPGPGLNAAKRIVYVYQDIYPWDVRCEKICSSLADHGNQVHILSRSHPFRPAQEVHRNGVDIHRLPKLRQNHANRVLSVPAFFSPLWILALRRLVRRTKADLIIVRDLPLAPAALLVGRWVQTPVLLDMAENYPAMIQDTWHYRGPTLLDRLIRNPHALRVMERFTVSQVDGALVVSPRSADRVIRLGAPAESVWVVGNTPQLTATHKDQVAPVPEAHDFRHEASCVLVYVGGMEESRGLDVVLRAIPTIVPTVPGFRFVVAGSGTALPRLRELASRLNVERFVRFLGNVPHAAVPALIQASDIGIVPHYVTEHTSTTLPNKLFDYMLCGKPVIVTAAPSLLDVLSRTSCGLSYDDSSPSDLANAVLALQDPALRIRMGASGLRAVLSTYNWSVDEQELLRAVAVLGRSRE